MNIPPAPLYRDPIYDGAADPTIVWNVEEKEWWLIYTNRRANVDCPGVSYCHGTDLGIAASRDGGQTWIYRGILEGLPFERGLNSFWAPEIVRHEGLYHMFVSYVRGVPHEWLGERHILHYTSHNLWEWHHRSRLELTSDKVIDACVHRLPAGRWRMWFKDEVDQSHTHAADSDDLFAWHTVGPVITDCAHEGPNVFLWQGWYWMIVDTWKGLGVYRSEDAETWVRQRDILGEPGSRPDDGRIGQHADVLVQGDRAFIFYFTHPQSGESLPEPSPGVWPYAWRRTSLQVAELSYVDGLVACDRDKPFDFVLAEA